MSYKPGFNPGFSTLTGFLWIMTIVTHIENYVFFSFVVELSDMWTSKSEWKQNK